METNYKRKDTSRVILDEIYACIEKQGGIVKTEELSELGIDYRRILDFVENGQLVRIKNGYYTDRTERFTEEELIAKLFPDALLCMESALFAYGYLRQKPFGWTLAVDKNTSKSRFKMDYPQVIPFYTEPETLKLGASKLRWNGQVFRIYDKDRLICDCLKYEGKMERADFKEAIQKYIKDPDKDISALLDYAKERKVLKKVQNMIGVWL